MDTLLLLWDFFHVVSIASRHVQCISMVITPKWEIQSSFQSNSESFKGNRFVPSLQLKLNHPIILCIVHKPPHERP